MMNGNYKRYFTSSKLHRPPVGKNYLHRQAILDSLSNGLFRPLTLVSAPAGYGKSTLISTWLDLIDIPGTWLSLDEQDNDPRQFLVGLLAALQAIFPDAGEEVQAMLAAPNPLPLQELTSNLIHDLDSIEREFILVLDDFYLINEKAVIEIIQELLRHPPRPMHLILVGRKDPFLPISTLRARDQITEIRINDLRFTESEVKDFIKITLDYQIGETTALELTKRTEGWITGIHLAILAARGQEDTIKELANLKGTTAYIMDYLITEVLSSQSKVIRQYLMVTSILGRFSGALCDALMGSAPKQDESQIDGPEFIARAKNQNLFLMPLDTENYWFRYHHLFRSLLQNQLNQKYSSEEIQTLHMRASEWFAAKGLFGEAIKHAVAAGKENRAVELVEQNRQFMLNSNSWPEFERWLFLLPAATIQQRPELRMSQVWAHYWKYRFDLIPQELDAVESLLGDDPGEQGHSILGEVSLFRGVFCYMQGEGLKAFNHLENALKLIPNAHIMVRGFANMYFGLAGQMTGQQEKVVNVLSDLTADPSIDFSIRLRSITALVWINLISGNLAVASNLNKQLMDAATKGDFASFISWGLYHQGLIHFHRNEIDLAIHYFSQATERGYLMLRRARVDCLVGITLAYQLKHELEQADATLESLFKYVGPFNDPVLVGIAYSCKERLSLMRGEAASEHGMQGINAKTNLGAMAIWLEVPAITQCRVLLARGSNADLKEAEIELLELIRLNQSHHNIYQLIAVMSLLATAHEKLGKTKEALTVLDRAVTLSQPGGFIFPFVEIGTPMADLLKRLLQQNVASDHIERILDAFEENKHLAVTKALVPDISSASIPTSQPLLEPLSNRELEILELLAKRLQNKEIAQELFISAETVKTHLRNIYQKLSVNNRRQAIDQAKHLGIIPSR